MKNGSLLIMICKKILFLSLLMLNNLNANKRLVWLAAKWKLQKHVLRLDKRRDYLIRLRDNNFHGWLDRIQIEKRDYLNNKIRLYSEIINDSNKEISILKNWLDEINK